MSNALANALVWAMSIAAGVSVLWLGRFFWRRITTSDGPIVRRILTATKPVPRLAIIESMAFDSKRRLVLIRRDHIEHLILTGGPTDLVIESGGQPSGRSEFSAHRAERPAARPGRSTASPDEITGVSAHPMQRHSEGLSESVDERSVDQTAAPSSRSAAN